MVEPRCKRTSRAVFLLTLGACSGGTEDTATPESVLLVTLDTTRADVLACDERSLAWTPAICALAREGIRFPRAYTVAPLTLPAHASMLTGLYPPRHGLRDNGFAALPEAATTLAEKARDSGRATAAFVSSAILDRGYGLAQGFERYDQPALGERTPEDFYLERDAQASAAALCAWLRELDPGRGFFAWLHLYDPHIPYDPPADALEQAGGDLYLGEVAFADRAVARVLSQLEESGLDASTWVVVTADHGEALGEHGEPTHGALCYEATMRVPLLFRPPRGAVVQPGSAHFASVVDLHPTLLGFLGLEVPTGLDGIDLFATDEQARQEHRNRGVYFESYSGYLHYGWSPLAGWVDRYGKYLHSSAPEFYLPEDPEERNNVARQRTRDCDRARASLAALFALPALDPDELERDERLLQAVRALGYAGIAVEASGLPSALEPSDRPAPRARAVELEPLHLANALVDAERYAEALAPLERILGGNPLHRFALDLFGLCLMHTGRFDEAEEALRRRMTLPPARADTHLNLALCLERRGDLEGALGELEAATDLDPAEPRVREALERVRTALEER